MSRAKIAAIQMVSGPELAPNLDSASRLLASAAAGGAALAALPENFYCIGHTERDKVAMREPDGSGPIQDFLASAARTHRMWLIGGTAPIVCDDDTRIRSACLVYDQHGERVGRYDKMHLFHFEHGPERYDERRTVQAGTGPLALASPFGRLALSVCYDVRFPELYRGLGEFDLMFVPSAFTVPTGAAHWETLLRARAIENKVYVVAPAQGGTHPGGRRTWGHSMIVDPWGEIVASRAEGEGVVFAEIDTDRIQDVRRRLS